MYWYIPFSNIISYIFSGARFRKARVLFNLSYITILDRYWVAHKVDMHTQNHEDTHMCNLPLLGARHT